MDNSDASRSGRDLTGVLLDNRYRVETKLGEGGMAQVYLASDERLGRPVVVKVPLEIFLTVSGFRERFAHEIHALINLDHPFIGKILDRGEMSGIPFAVLQYLPGGSLMARMEEAGGRLTPEQIATWLPRVASALDFIHTRNFLHRDIKPANILFDSEHNVYIADFGIAKVLGDKEFTNLTQTGTLPGTVAYMAPEAGEHKTPGPAYDQYALAVVVYQALSGDLPHELGDSPISALVQKIIADPVPLSRVRPDLPAAVCDAVMKALSASPDDRFDSCKAFADAFKEGMGTDPAVAAGEVPAAAAERAGGEAAGFDPQLPTEPMSAPIELSTIVLPEQRPPITPDGSPIVLPDEEMRYDPLAPLSRPKRRSSISLPKGILTKIISSPGIVLARLSALSESGRRRLVIVTSVVIAAFALIAIYLTFVAGPRPPSTQPGDGDGDPTASSVAPGMSAYPPQTEQATNDETTAQAASSSTGSDASQSEPAPAEGTDPQAAPTQEPPGPPAERTPQQGNDAPAGGDEPASPQEDTPPPVETVQPGGDAEAERAAAPVGETRAPRRVSAVAPGYPELPFALGIEGEVAVEATIGTDGSVRDATVTHGLHPMLDLAALEAVAQWTYEPALRNGEPREYPLTARLTFDLPATQDPGPVESAGIERARQLDTTRFLARLAAALEDFRRQTGSYPDALDQLQPLMQIVPTLDSWDTPLWYRNFDDEYWLISFGRDAAPGPVPPQPWRVGEAFEADLRVHSGDFEQVPEDPAAGSAEAAPSDEAAAAPSGAAAITTTIETVPITDEVVPPVLNPDSVAFLLDRTVQDQIGLTERRVSVYCLVTEEGKVAEARVLQVDPEIAVNAMAEAFDAAARHSAIDTWRFQPATQDGVPVAVWRLVHVRYQPVR